jgi:acyl-CoA thioesterase FadM
MYPFLRLALNLVEARRAGPLDLFAPHETAIRIWPWDLDPWRELNNGRTLTLFDLGRIPMSVRMGFERVARARGWGITVAGTNVRYRRRVTLFQKVTCVSRLLGWDDRFGYIEQSFWRAGECTSHMLLRYAFPSKSGMVNPAEVVAALGHDPVSPALPDWVRAWVEADRLRPWPPARD